MLPIEIDSPYIPSNNISNTQLHFNDIITLSLDIGMIIIKEKHDVLSSYYHFGIFYSSTINNQDSKKEELYEIKSLILKQHDVIGNVLMIKICYDSLLQFIIDVNFLDEIIMHYSSKEIYHFPHIPSHLLSPINLLSYCKISFNHFKQLCSSFHISALVISNNIQETSFENLENQLLFKRYQPLMIKIPNDIYLNGTSSSSLIIKGIDQLITSNTNLIINHAVYYEISFWFHKTSNDLNGNIFYLQNYKTSLLNSNDNKYKISINFLNQIYLTYYDIKEQKYIQKEYITTILTQWNLIIIGHNLPHNQLRISLYDKCQKIIFSKVINDILLRKLTSETKIYIGNEHFKGYLLDIRIILNHYIFKENIDLCLIDQNNLYADHDKTCIAMKCLSPIRINHCPMLNGTDQSVYYHLEHKLCQQEFSFASGDIFNNFSLLLPSFSKYITLDFWFLSNNIDIIDNAAKPPQFIMILQSSLLHQIRIIIKEQPNEDYVMLRGEFILKGFPTIYTEWIMITTKNQWNYVRISVNCFEQIMNIKAKTSYKEMAIPFSVFPILFNLLTTETNGRYYFQDLRLFDNYLIANVDIANFKLYYNEFGLLRHYYFNPVNKEKFSFIDKATGDYHSFPLRNELELLLSSLTQIYHVIQWEIKDKTQIDKLEHCDLSFNKGKQCYYCSKDYVNIAFECLKHCPENYIIKTMNEYSFCVPNKRISQGITIKQSIYDSTDKIINTIGRFIDLVISFYLKDESNKNKSEQIKFGLFTLMINYKYLTLTLIYDKKNYSNATISEFPLVNGAQYHFVVEYDNKKVSLWLNGFLLKSKYNDILLSDSNDDKYYLDITSVHSSTILILSFRIWSNIPYSFMIIYTSYLSKYKNDSFPQLLFEEAYISNSDSLHLKYHNCARGKYYNVIKGKCDNCPLNCNECYMDLYHSIICSSCRKKYALVNNECLSYTFPYYIKQTNSTIIKLRNYLYNPNYNYYTISFHFLIKFNTELLQETNNEIVLYTIDKSIILLIKNNMLIIKGNSNEVSYSEIICHHDLLNWNFYSININFNFTLKQYDLYAYINGELCSIEAVSFQWKNNANGEIFLSNIEIIDKISYSIAFFIVSTKNYHKEQHILIGEILSNDDKTLITKIIPDEISLHLIEIISQKQILQEGINQIGYEASYSFKNIICKKGLYYSMIINKCSQCNINCSECLDGEKCIICSLGYHLGNSYQCESNDNKNPISIYSQLYDSYIKYDYSIVSKVYQSSSLLLSQAMTIENIDIKNDIDFTIDFWIFTSSNILQKDEGNIAFNLEVVDIYKIALIYDNNKINDPITLQCNTIDKIIQVNQWYFIRCAINFYKEITTFGLLSNEQYYSRQYSLFTSVAYKYDINTIRKSVKYSISKDLLNLLLIKDFCLWTIYLDQFNLTPSPQTYLIKYNSLFENGLNPIDEIKYELLIPELYYPIKTINDIPIPNLFSMIYAEDYNIRLNYIPVNYYKDNLRKVLRQCHHSCLSCNGKFKTDCLSCSSTSHIFDQSNSLCLSQCLNNTYYDQITSTCLSNQSLIKFILLKGNNYIDTYTYGNSRTLYYFTIEIMIILEEDISNSLTSFDYLSQFTYEIKELNSNYNKDDIHIKAIQLFGQKIVFEIRNNNNEENTIKLFLFTINIKNTFTQFNERKEFFTFVSSSVISPYIKVITNKNMVNINDYPIIIKVMNVFPYKTLLLNTINEEDDIEYNWIIKPKEELQNNNQIEFNCLNFLCSSIILYEYSQSFTIELILNISNSSTIIYNTIVDYSIKQPQNEQNLPYDTYIKLSKNSTLNDLILLEDQFPIINYEYKIKAIPIINHRIHSNLSISEIAYISNWSIKYNSDFISQNTQFDYLSKHKRYIPLIYTSNINSIYLITKEKQNDFFTGLTHKKYNPKEGTLNTDLIDIDNYFYCEISPKIIKSFINDTLVVSLYKKKDFEYLYYKIIIKDYNGLYYRLNTVPILNQRFTFKYFPHITLMYMEIVAHNGFHYRLNCLNNITYSNSNNKDLILLSHQSIFSFAQEVYHFDLMQQFNMIYFYSTYMKLSSNEARRVYSLFKESSFVLNSIDKIDSNSLLHFLMLMNNHSMFYLDDTDYYKRILDQFLSNDYLLYIYSNNAQMFYCFYQNLLDINYSIFIHYKERITMTLGRITHDNNYPMIFLCKSLKDPSLIYRTFLYRINYFNERTIELFTDDNINKKRIALIENINIPLNDYPKNILEDFIMIISIEEKPIAISKYNIVGNERYTISKYYLDNSNISLKERDYLYTNINISFKKDDVSNMACVAVLNDDKNNNKTNVCESWFSDHTYVNCICNYTGTILLIKDKTYSEISKENQINRLLISISIIHIIFFNSVIFLPILLLLIQKYYIFTHKKFKHKSATESFYQREIILDKIYCYLTKTPINQLRSIIFFIHLCLTRISKMIHIFFPLKSELYSYVVSFDRYDFYDLYYLLCFFIAYFIGIMFTLLSLYIIQLVDKASIVNYSERNINTRFYKHYADLRQMPFIKGEIILLLFIGVSIGKIVVYFIDRFVFDKSFNVNKKIYKGFIMHLAKKIRYNISNKTQKKFIKAFNMVIFLIRYYKKMKTLAMIKEKHNPIEKPINKQDYEIDKYHSLPNAINMENKEKEMTIITKRNQIEIDDQDELSLINIKQTIISLTFNAITLKSYQYDNLLVLKSTREFLFSYLIIKSNLKQGEYSIEAKSIWYIPKKVNNVLNFSNGKRYCYAITFIFSLSFLLLQYFLIKCIQFYGLSIIYIIAISILIIILIEYIILDLLEIMTIAFITFNSRSNICFTQNNQITVRSPSLLLKCIIKSRLKSGIIVNFISIINLIIKNQ